MNDSDGAIDASPEPGRSEASPGDVPLESTDPRPEVDLARIERDLSGVDVALGRLDDGTYWTDEVTGEPIPDRVLADDPVARRSAPES